MERQQEYYYSQTYRLFESLQTFELLDHVCTFHCRTWDFFEPSLFGAKASSLLLSPKNETFGKFSLLLAVSKLEEARLRKDYVLVLFSAEVITSVMYMTSWGKPHIWWIRWGFDPFTWVLYNKTDGDLCKKFGWRKTVRIKSYHLFWCQRSSSNF